MPELVKKKKKLLVTKLNITKVMQDKYTFESDENAPQKEKLGFSED